MKKIILTTMLISTLSMAEVFTLDHNNTNEISFKSVVYESEQKDMICTKYVNFGKSKNHQIVSLKGSIECSFGKKKAIMEKINFNNKYLSYSKYDAFGVNLENFKNPCPLCESKLKATYIEISNNISSNSVDLDFGDFKYYCENETDYNNENQESKNREIMEQLTSDTQNCPPSWQVGGRCLKSYFEYKPDGGWYCDQNDCE